MATTFGGWLSHQLAANHLTGKDAALHLGVDAATISRLRTGKQQPERHHLRPLAALLGIPILEVLVAADYLTADEAGAAITPPSVETASIDDLLAEIRHRVVTSATHPTVPPATEATDFEPAARDSPWPTRRDRLADDLDDEHPDTIAQVAAINARLDAKEASRADYDLAAGRGEDDVDQSHGGWDRMQQDEAGEGSQNSDSDGDGGA